MQADSTAWATQLRLLAAQLVHRLNAELGAGTVLRVKVRGPVTADENQVNGGSAAAAAHVTRTAESRQLRR